MSETKNVSLKDNEGKVYASILPMSDGRWCEVKNNYTEPINKQIVHSEKEWITRNLKNNSSVCTTVESTTGWLPWHPKCPTLRDADYLREMKVIYNNNVWSPEKEILPHERAESYQRAIQWIQFDLTHATNQAIKTSCISRLKLAQEALAEEQRQIEKLGAKPEATYFPLTRETTAFYIENNNELVPIGYDEQCHKIVVAGKGATTFSAFGFPENPVLYLLMDNSLFKEIKDNIILD